MSSERYVLLEANRLRSIDIDQRERTDVFKNKWTNLVSSSGIKINAGDVVSVQQVIVNTKGASDSVIEFTGDTNDEGFKDNKVDLTYSYYVNHTGKNTFALPSINHKVYIGNNEITAPTISNNQNTAVGTPGITTFSTLNGAIPATNQIQTMLSRRSLGEYLFGPTHSSAAFFGNNSTTLDGKIPNNYFDGGYVLRMNTSRTGFGIEDPNTPGVFGGYTAGQVYPVMRLPNAADLTGVVINITETYAAGATFVIAEFNPILMTDYTLAADAGDIGVVGAIDFAFGAGVMKITFRAPAAIGSPALAAGQVFAVSGRYNAVPITSASLGEATGMRVRVLTTTPSSAQPPNQVLTWEIEECDAYAPNIIHGPIYDPNSLSTRTCLLQLSVEITQDATGFGLRQLDNLVYHQYEVHSTIKQESFMSGNDKKFDGSRYYMTNQGYTGLASKSDNTDAGGAPETNTDSLDIETLIPDLDKRKTTTTLEIEPSFATPDNIGSILTDQLHQPTHISLDKPEGDFINYQHLDYKFRSVQPLGRQCQSQTAGAGAPFGGFDVRYHNQDGDNFAPENKPTIISTPTYKPVVCNMFGKGLPNYTFTDGSIRNSNQPSFAGLRRIFYDSVAYKEFKRVMALKSAFYNFNFNRPTGQLAETTSDLYVGTIATAFANRAAAHSGDYGNQFVGELGMRTCILNNFATSGGGKCQYPKHGLIMTNMKFNESNLIRLSKSFRQIEKYLGNLDNKVDTSSDDFKKHLAVNLDIGMYNDELSANGHLQFFTSTNFGSQFRPPPPADPKPSNQRVRFGAFSETAATGTTMPAVDRTGVCGGRQKDFTDNDQQQLSSIWVQSRFQEGFVYENTKHPKASYTGDKIEGIDTLLTQQQTSPFFASRYSVYNLANDTAAGNFKFLQLTQDDHTTRLPAFTDATALNEQPFRVGDEIIATAGTINGQSIVGTTATITNINMTNTAPGTLPNITLAGGGLGFVLGGESATGVKIRVIDADEGDYFYGDWDNGTKNVDYATALARKYDLAVVPVFNGIHDPTTNVSAYHTENRFPLIAFISTYKLDDFTGTFDTTNLANPTNFWEIDKQNCPVGIQMGFDPTFTRNEAVAVCNITPGNTDPASPDNYPNLMYIGAVNPAIEFNPDLSRFELQGLNTPMTIGNGLPSDIPQNLSASETPQQQCYRVNQLGKIYPSRPKIIGTALNTTTNGTTTFSPVNSQFKSVQKHGSLMDSQSGIAIESLSLYDDKDSTTEITAEEFAKYRDTLLSKLGFDLNQILIPLGDEQAFFVNNFIFQDTLTYKKAYNSITNPMTTGAFISSAEIQALSLNELNMPLMDLGVDSIVRQAQPDCEQGSLTAFGLPSKLDYPYLVVYSDIPGGCSNTEFVGGSDSQSMIPAVAYLYRNENNGDFFYGLESDISFTAVKDYMLTEVDIDIRRPDGRRPRLSPHSAVIFKITKPLQVPNLQMILQKPK